MDNNNWRPIQGGEPAMDAVDWRTQLQPDSRQRIVNKIMDTLKKHLPFAGQDGLHELKKIAERFEEKIYSAATNQSDYLRKISLKMLTMETKSQNTIPNTMPTNQVGTSNRPPDQGSLGMQSQVHNQGQSLGMPLPPNQPQTRQQLITQNIQNSAGFQSSSSLSSALPSATSLSQTSIPTVVGQNMQGTNMQGVPANSQNSVGNPMGQGVANMYANSQRQMQGRQQVVNQQQQQPQNSQQFLFLQQLQQQLLKPKFNQGNMPQSVMQPHMRQQQLTMSGSQGNNIPPQQIQNIPPMIMQQLQQNELLQPWWQQQQQQNQLLQQWRQLQQQNQSLQQWPKQQQQNQSLQQWQQQQQQQKQMLLNPKYELEGVPQPQPEQSSKQEQVVQMPSATQPSLTQPLLAKPADSLHREGATKTAHGRSVVKLGKLMKLPVLGLRKKVALLVVVLTLLAVVSMALMGFPAF